MTQMKICRKCHDELTQGGMLPLQWYIEICSHFIYNITPLIHDGKEGKGDTLTHYLESKRFVISTEVATDMLAIKPVGYFKHNDVDVFCRDVETHGQS